MRNRLLVRLYYTSYISVYSLREEKGIQHSPLGSLVCWKAWLIIFELQVDVRLLPWLCRPDGVHGAAYRLGGSLMP